MNTPQFPTRSPVFPTQPPEVPGFNKAPGFNEGGGINATTVVFNGKNVNKYVLSNFFKEMTQGGMKQLAEDTCAQAARVHDKLWKRDNLVTDLKAYGLPVDCDRRAQLKDRKTSAIMNVFLKVKEESEKAIDQGGSGDNLEVAKGLCDLLNGTDVRVNGKPHKPYFVDMNFFAGEMNKCQQKLDAARSAIGSLGQESQGVNEPGLPPAENPAFTMEGQPLLPSGNAPTMTPSAPPNYDVVQAEIKLAELNTQIAHLQQGVTQDFQSPHFQHQLSLVQMDIMRLGFNLPVNLQEQYIQAKADLDGLQQQQLAMQEGARVIEFHGQIDGLKQTLAQSEPKIDNKTEIKALERKVKALDDQIGKLSSPESGPHKEELKERLSELNISISQWFSVVTAFEILEGLKSDLKGFQYQQLPAEVSSFSAKRDALDAIVRKIPSGELRNQLIKESSILKQSFSEIQKNVQQNHLITELEKAENIIKVMECDFSGGTKLHQVEQARAALVNAESLSLEEGADHCFVRLSNLKERLSKFEGSAAAAQMQSSARGDAEKVIAHIDQLISEAEVRLSGQEKNREAVNGIPLNQTHMDEVQANLHQISEKIIQELTGRDLRDERERLQSMCSSLLSRLDKLQGGGASSGQPTAASAQTVSGNQDHTEVDNISKVLDVAEAPIEALTSNPNSSAKDDLITKARSNLEKATQMIGRLTDDALRPLRTELSTRLGHLNKQLSLIESGGGQGQVTPAEPQPEVLLQKGVAAFKKEMDEFGKKGAVSNAGFAAATANMSALLGQFASSHSAIPAVPSSQNVLQPPVAHTPVRQSTLLHAGPVMTRPVRANGDSLASFANALNFTNTIISHNSYSIASVGIKPSSEKIKSLVTSTDIPFESLPFDVQERMMEAYNCGNHQPTKIKLVQVYAFAPDQSDFNGASFQVRLDSILPNDHRQIYLRSSLARYYSPLGANLRMPEGLKQGNPFYEARWSLNENLDRQNTVSFAHGSGGDSHSNLEDIGFTLVAPVLKALGASTEEATSAEAGFGIPFGIDLRKQPQTVLNELQQYTTQRHFGFQVPDVTDGVVPDGGALDSDVVSDSESLGSSGINPLALHTKSTHGISSRVLTSEIFAREVGILWVKTVTDLPEVNSQSSLIDWVVSNKPESENLRLPQLL
ncbi:hypothetical protein ACTL6P_20635 [Endozoicomonas acroporae]|uniref:hypothetical protein n=1 Tax=Endozoicomonas acroporae TaxID=1701104 RepID=UPI000C7811B0|nr:hypothetical protein [Endozoicomonas acroporae]